jgi:tetratricopeptide (TPR) repeat protein
MRPGLLTHSLTKFSVLTLLVAAAGPLGCGARGQHNREFAQQAQIKMDGLKSGLEWQMAQQQFLAGDLEKALSTVEKSIELNPKVARAHVLKGRILMERGNLEGARLALLEAAKLDEKLADAPYYLGVIHERFTQREEALTWYTAAAKLDPGNAQYIIAAADMLVENGELARADSLLAEPGDALKHNAAIRHTRGRIAALQEDPERAEALLTEASLLAPDDAVVLEDLLRAQLANGKFAQAELTAASILKMPGMQDRPDIQRQRAECLMEMGQLADARSVLLDLTARYESDAAAWRLLGEVCVRTQDTPRLRNVAARLIALSPERFEGYLYRAMHLRGAGQLPAAIDSASQATARAGGSSLPFIYRAMLLKDAGKLDEARSAAAHAAQIDPESQVARQLVELLDRSASIASVPEPR